MLTCGGHEGTKQFGPLTEMTRGFEPSWHLSTFRHFSGRQWQRSLVWSSFLRA